MTLKERKENNPSEEEKNILKRDKGVKKQLTVANQFKSIQI